jgi:hypothetical protein
MYKWKDAQKVLLAGLMAACLFGSTGCAVTKKQAKIIAIDYAIGQMQEASGKSCQFVHAFLDEKIEELKGKKAELQK